MDPTEGREQAEADVSAAEAGLDAARRRLEAARRARAALPRSSRVIDALMTAAGLSTPTDRPILDRIAELDGLIEEARGLYGEEMTRFFASQSRRLVLDPADDLALVQVAELVRSLNGERRGLVLKLQKARCFRVYTASTERHKRTLARREIDRIAPLGKTPGLFRELRRRVDQRVSA